MDEEERNPIARLTDPVTQDPVKQAHEEEAEVLEEEQAQSTSQG